MATFSILGGTTGARQDQEKEEGTDGAPEPTMGSPRPLSLGDTGDVDSEGDLTPLPSAQTSVRAASSVRWPSARTAATRPPPPLVPYSTGGPTVDSCSELIRVGEVMSLRSCWRAVTSARDLRAAHMAFEQHVEELKWMESLRLRAATEQMRRDGLTSGTPATFAGGTRRAWPTAIVPFAAAAVAPAPESEAATQPLERTDTVDRQAAELVAQPPPLEPLGEGDSRPPLPLPLPRRSPPHARGWMACQWVRKLDWEFWWRQRG
ncbi:hypothetical protein ACSSS7_001390 [Eimeria intestinalis]